MLSARQAISEMLYEADGTPKKGLGPKEDQVLKDIYAKVNEQLDPANPALRTADKEIAQVAKEKQAFEGGQKIYENPRGAPTEVEFKADLRRDVSWRTGADFGWLERRDLPADRHSGKQPDQTERPDEG